MTFKNLQIDTHKLPAAGALEMEFMAPQYAREVLSQQSIVFGILLLVSVIPYFVIPDSVAVRNYFALLPFVIVLLAALIIPLTLKMAHIKGIALREHDIVYRSGLYWRKSIVLAFNRVQHIEVTTGPLQRRFGLASLKFFTAGGSSVDLKVDGLTRVRAEQLREFILLNNKGRDDG